jgi:hypothetical protein
MARSKSYYEYVESANGDDLDQIKIDGQIMPLRSTADQKIMRGEDVVWLMEAVKQRATQEPYALPFVAYYTYESYAWTRTATAIEPAKFYRKVCASNFGNLRLPNSEGKGMKNSLDRICNCSVYSLTEPVVGNYVMCASYDKSGKILVTRYGLQTIPDSLRYHADVADIAKGDPPKRDTLIAYFKTIAQCRRMFGKIAVRTTYPGWANATGTVPYEGQCDVLGVTSGSTAALGYYYDYYSLNGSSRLQMLTLYWQTSKDSESRACATNYVGLAADAILAKFEAKFVKRAFGVLYAYVEGFNHDSDYTTTKTVGQFVAIPLGDAVKDGDVFTFEARGVLEGEQVKQIFATCGVTETPAQNAKKNRSCLNRISLYSVEVVLEFDDHTYYEAS